MQQQDNLTPYISGPLLAGKRALIVGAGSVAAGWGNGRATMSVFLNEGAQVAGIDRSLDALHQTENVTSEFHKIVCDVTDTAALAQAIELALDALGGLDILVNNVGASAKGNILSLSPDEWQRQLDLNLNYAFNSMRLVLPDMIEQGNGSIVNIGSIAGIRCLESEAVAYATSKAALIQLSRTTAISVASKGVRVNTVIPGLMNTPLVTKRLAEFEGSVTVDALVAERNKKVPMGQMGRGGISLTRLRFSLLIARNRLQQQSLSSMAV